MRSSVWRRVRLGAYAVLTLTACDAGSTAPPPPPLPPLSDPAAVSAAILAIDSAFGTPAIQSLALTGALMTVGPAPAAASAAATLAACAATPASPPAAAGSPLFPAGVIPDSLLRRVFVYDTLARAYRPSSAASGPPSGVRFLLYGLDPVYPQLAMPLTTIGWLDLSDASYVGGGLALRAGVVNGTAANADYVVSPLGTRSSYTAHLTGTVASSTRVFTVRDSTAVEFVQTSISASVTDSTHDLSLRLIASRDTIDAYDNYYDFDFMLTHGTEQIRLVGDIQQYCNIPSIGATFSVNGADFAAVTNGTSGPVAARVDGQPLTPEQQAAVFDMLFGQQRLFLRLAALLTPVRQFLAP